MSLTYSESEFRELAERLNANGGSVPVSVPKPEPGTRTAARARVTAGIVFKSNLEKLWWETGAPIIAEKFGSPVARSYYEPFSMNIAGGSYTVDFMYILADGRVILLETKGNIRMKNARDSRTKFRAAATEFSPFYFVWVEQIERGQPGYKFEIYDPYSDPVSSISTIYLIGGNSRRRSNGRKRVKP